jgi:ATP-dependent 26S proteasome regulatory subunit
MLGIETKLEKEIRELHENPMKVLSVEKTSDRKQAIITHTNKNGIITTTVYLEPLYIRH